MLQWLEIADANFLKEIGNGQPHSDYRPNAVNTVTVNLNSDTNHRMRSLNHNIVAFFP